MRKRNAALIAGLTAAGLVGAYMVLRRQRPSLPKTYLEGLKSVNMTDEYKHNVPSWSEFWAPVYLFKDAYGVAWKWGGNFENIRVESITKPDAQTIRIYGDGIEFILKPGLGYRKVSVDSAFLSSPLRDYIGWRPVKVGDVAELQTYMPKSVFWQNRSQPLSVGIVKNFMHYQPLGTVTLRRPTGEIFNGFGSFQHVWMSSDFYAVQRSLTRQDAFHVFTDRFILFIQGGVYSKVNITDGAVYFLDDGSYDVLGDFVGGYSYQVVDGALRLSYRLMAETHRGPVEVMLTESADAQPMVQGFQQANWAGINATLAGEEVDGLAAGSETVR